MDWLVFTSSFDYFPSWQVSLPVVKFTVSVNVECNYSGTGSAVGLVEVQHNTMLSILQWPGPTPGYHPTDHC